jgi:hypothetical protein
VKHVLLGCAAALALSLAAPVAALADNPPSDVDAAHAARVRADADLAKTKQETKAAISASAHSQQAAITNSANHRTHRIATVAQRRQRQIAASAKTRKAHIANDADAQKKAIDAQHP